MLVRLTVDAFSNRCLSVLRLYDDVSEEGVDMFQHLLHVLLTDIWLEELLPQISEHVQLCFCYLTDTFNYLRPVKEFRFESNLKANASQNSLQTFHCFYIRFL